MRYVRQDLLLASAPQLIIDANVARAEILAADPGVRGALIDHYRTIWVAFRPYLADISHAKCWYTESENPGTDDDVDHFRPKGRLADDEQHGGYWWEALHWRNFRFSCHRANRLRENPLTHRTHGKGDHFPLINEEDRCTTPADDLRREKPLLLDPVDPADPPMLDFNIDGTIAVAPDYQNEPNAHRRIDASRIYLHLEWPRFTEQRQELYREIGRKVDRGQQHALMFEQNPADNDALKQIARDLIALTEDQRPYSRAARAFIKTFRHVSWVKNMVIPNFS
jgi:hypothetical protein